MTSRHSDRKLPDALALVKLERFDLLLVNNWMPELLGPDLTRQVREFNTSTPILFTQERRRNLTSKRLAIPTPKASSQSRWKFRT